MRSHQLRLFLSVGPAGVTFAVRWTARCLPKATTVRKLLAQESGAAVLAAPERRRDEIWSGGQEATDGRGNAAG
jgi:hypothetical protein